MVKIMRRRKYTYSTIYRNKSVYKQTHVIQTHVVQGSAVYSFWVIQ